MTERVTRLTLGNRAEERGNVRLTLDVGLLREVEVPAVGLALARECGLGGFRVSAAAVGMQWRFQISSLCGSSAACLVENSVAGNFFAAPSSDRNTTTTVKVLPFLHLRFT